MRFIRVREVLGDQIAPYHRELGEMIRRVLPREIPPRVRMLAEYLVEYEENRAGAIHSFIDECSENGTLDLWTPHPDMTLHLDLSRFDDDALSDYDHLSATLLACRNRLIEYLDACAAAATDPSVRRLFASLRMQEERGVKRFARQILGLSDL